MRCEEDPGRQREARGGGPGLAGLCQGRTLWSQPGAQPGSAPASQARGPPSPRWHLQGWVQGTELATRRHSPRWTDEKSSTPSFHRRGEDSDDSACSSRSLRKALVVLYTRPVGAQNHAPPALCKNRPLTSCKSLLSDTHPERSASAPQNCPDSLLPAG